jgi:hypothetical protein
MGIDLGLTPGNTLDVKTGTIKNAPKLFDAVFAVGDQYPPPPRSLNTTDLQPFIRFFRPFSINNSHQKTVHFVSLFRRGGRTAFDFAPGRLDRLDDLSAGSNNASRSLLQNTITRIMSKLFYNTIFKGCSNEKAYAFVRRACRRGRRGCAK